MRMRRSLHAAMVVLTVLLGTAVYTAAQIATATLLGVIRDDPGAALPGAAVTVKRVATGVTRSAISDSEGRYRVSALDPGEYDVHAELANFKTAVRTGVVLTVGGTTEADIRMSLRPITEQVTVVTGPPLGAPIATNRPFFFGNYEGQVREQSNRVRHPARRVNPRQVQFAEKLKF